MKRATEFFTPRKRERGESSGFSRSFGQLSEKERERESSPIEFFSLPGCWHTSLRRSLFSWPVGASSITSSPFSRSLEGQKRSTDVSSRGQHSRTERERDKGKRKKERKKERKKKLTVEARRGLVVFRGEERASLIAGHYLPKLPWRTNIRIKAVPTNPNVSGFNLLCGETQECRTGWRVFRENELLAPFAPLLLLLLLTLLA